MAPGQPAPNSTQYLPYPFSEQARAPLLTDGTTPPLNTGDIEEVLDFALQIKDMHDVGVQWPANDESPVKVTVEADTTALEAGMDIVTSIM